MCSSDYPHTAFTLPHPRDIIERDFRDTSELAKRKIVREKVAQLYGFDLTKPAEEERHVYRSRRHQYE